MGTLGRPAVAPEPHGPDLIGRSRELASVEAFLEALDRLPAVMWLLGEPGIGKSTVWERTISAAHGQGFVSLEARPSESEAKLAFAALGDLLGDVQASVADRLPEPQRRALQAALLVEDYGSSSPDQRTIGVAVLSTLRLLAQRQPVLIAIDDEQWLDEASATVIGFAVRRLTSERIALVLARREGQGRDAAAAHLRTRLPTEAINLAGLSVGALHAIVVERFATVLPRPQLRRLHHLSRGNPFLAMELVRAVSAGRLRLDAGGPASADLDRLVGARLDALPAGTRQVLLAAAAMSRPTIAALGRAANADAEALMGPAVAAGIVEVSGPEVGFTHPILASAAYGAASADDRRTMHARLALLVEDPIERARHLALAAAEADEAVAAEVEGAAEAVFHRGAPAAAAELAEMAVRLTPSDRHAEHRRRSAAQAEYLFESGDTASAAVLLEHLISSTPRGEERAVLLALLARIRHFGDDVESGVALNRQALEEAGENDGLSAGIHEGLAWGMFLMREDLEGAARHAGLAVGAATKAKNDVALAEALAAQALTTLAVGALVTGAIERAIALEPAFRDLRVLRHPTYAKGYVLACEDRLDEARALFIELLARAEEQGDESAVPSILVQLSMVELLRGAWDAADDHARTGYALAEQSGQRPSQAALRSRQALVAAFRGQPEAAEALGSEALALAGAREDDPATTRLALSRGAEIGAWALGATAIGEGRFESAYRTLAPMANTLLGAGMREPGELRFLPDLVETLIGLGRLDDADSLAREMEAMAAAANRDTSMGIAARCRALVLARGDDLAAALEAARSAVARLQDGPLPFELARSCLVLGDLQRRAQHKRAARETLADAIATFDTLGAHGWSKRARDVAARIGGRTASADGLTPSETRVAKLVSEGLANKEIASALGIATKTVELHLSHVYAKLGVGSRTELVRRMSTVGMTGQNPREGTND